MTRSGSSAALRLAASLAGLAAMPQMVADAPRVQSAVLTGRVVDAKGWTMPGVSVSAMPGAGGPTARAATNLDGAYRFEALPDGTYRLDFDLYGFDIIRRNNVRVQAAAPARIDATLVVSARCECVQRARPIGLEERDGRVVDEAGRPLPHARLEIVSPARRDMAYAGADGRFRVRLPTTDAWPLTVSDSGFGAVSQLLSGSAAEPIVLTLRHTGLAGLPDLERLTRPCRCHGDLFTHDVFRSAGLPIW